MKYKFLPVVFPIALVLFSCGNNDKTEESTKDTVVNVVVDTVVQTITADVDTAAIIAEYEAAFAKTKSTNKTPVYKEKNKKQVAVYPEMEIESKAPANVVVDPAGYNYKADKNAAYPGGRKAFEEYFYKNFVYPDLALEYGIQGTIYAEVFISETGAVEKIEFPGRKLGYGLEEEAKRVLLGVKQVEPAIKNGVPAKERYVLPITVHIK